MWEPDYLERETLKSYVTSGAAGVDHTADDEWLDVAITAASRAIDRACSDPHGRGIRRQFGLLDSAEARYYTPHYSEARRRWVVEIDDVMDTTGLAVTLDDDEDDVYDVVVTDYVLLPRNAASLNRPYTALAFSRTASVLPTEVPDCVRATVRWGWSPTWPATISQAGLIQASRFFARKQAPFGVRGSPDDNSQQTVLDRVDADVAEMLVPYKRPVETPE